MKWSRREVLSGGAVATGAALPLQLAAAADRAARHPDPQSGESLALARFVTRTRFEDLPADVVEMTKRAILDAVGVSLAASGLEPACKPFIDHALESGGAREGSILGTGRRVPVVQAALANGALAHAMDYEDAHEETRTHPHAAAIAAALPLAEQRAASGRELIVAVALGCDLVCRLARALVTEGMPPPGFYQPAIVGTFGAATAAAKLLGLSPGQVLDTWSLALCQNSCSAELQHSPETQIRATREGPCARVGLEAALLAARGVRGFEAPFEGRSGFFVMYGQGMQQRTLLGQLGERFAGREVSFKAWPSCRDTHVYVQAALELLSERSIDPNEITAVTATVAPQNMIVCEPAALKRRPRNAIGGKFSLYYTLASALLDRRVNFASFSEAALERPTVLALADRVTYRIDAAAARRGEVLEVALRDGTLHRRVVPAVYGSPAAPLPIEALVAKFVDCGGHAQQARNAAQLRKVAATVLALDQVASVREVIAQL